jgi:hypothetical protein
MKGGTMPEKPDAKIFIFREKSQIFRIEIFDPRGKRVFFFVPPKVQIADLYSLIPQTMQIIEENKTKKGGK